MEVDEGPCEPSSQGSFLADRDSFFLDDGLEFALYSLGIMFPDLVCDNIHPVINTSSNLYNHPDLTISFDDPVFGIAKKQFFQYY